MKLIAGIKKNVVEYDRIATDTKNLKNKTDLNREQTKIEVSKNTLCASIVEKKIKVQFRLLRKTLPDLASIQVTDADGNDLLKSFIEAVADGPNS